MKYRIIGDIHGRHNWHNLIEPFKEDTTYVFVGDYTDPYYGYEKGVNYQGMIEEINYILKFKQEHIDNIVLLIGNHDMQYIINEGDTNRFDRKNYIEIRNIFENNKDLFHGAAYNIGEKYLITHAGVTSNWFSRYIEDYNIKNDSLSFICNKINELWNTNKNAFTFSSNVTKLSDYYGISPTHSPLWIRPTSLWEHNIFGYESGKIQIVGHTPYESIHINDEQEGKIATFGTKKEKMTQEEIEQEPDYWIMDDFDHKCTLICNDKEHEDIIFVDCLRKESACIEIDDNTLQWEKIIK